MLAASVAYLRGGGRRRRRGARSRQAAPEPAGRITPDPCARIRSGCRAVRSRGAPRTAHARGGEELLPRCRRVLLEFESLGERARALRKGEGGVLRIGATPQVIEGLLSPFLRRYEQRHPGTEVQLVEDGGARLPRRLERGDVQLAVLPEGEAAFECRPLFPMHLIAVVAAGHRLARRATVELPEIADEPLLLLGREFASRTWFDAVGEVVPHQITDPGRSAVPQTLLALARDGHGVAMVPSTVTVPPDGLRAEALLHRNASIGRGPCWREIRAVCWRAMPPRSSTSWRSMCNVSTRAERWCVAHHPCLHRRACTALDARGGCWPDS